MITVGFPPIKAGTRVVIRGTDPVVVTVTQSSQGGSTPVTTVRTPPAVSGGIVVQNGVATVVVIVTQFSQGGDSSVFPGAYG